MYLRPDLSTFAVFPWAHPGGEKVGRMICDIYRPDGEPFEGCPRSTLKRVIAMAAERGFEMNAGPGGRVLPLPAAQRRPDDGNPRHGELLRPHARRPGRGRAPGDRAGAGVDGLPRGGRAPRSRRGPARDRLSLRRRADDGRQHQHVPVRGEERRAAARPARDLHAQADLRDQRLGDAHAPVAAVGREEQLLRSRRGHGSSARRACITSAACFGMRRAFARSPTRW